MIQILCSQNSPRGQFWWSSSKLSTGLKYWKIQKGRHRTNHNYFNFMGCFRNKKWQKLRTVTSLFSVGARGCNLCFLLSGNSSLPSNLVVFLFQHSFFHFDTTFITGFIHFPLSYHKTECVMWRFNRLIFKPVPKAIIYLTMPSHPSLHIMLHNNLYLQHNCSECVECRIYQCAQIRSAFYSRSEPIWYLRISWFFKNYFRSVWRFVTEPGIVAAARFTDVFEKTSPNGGSKLFPNCSKKTA